MPKYTVNMWLYCKHTNGNIVTDEDVLKEFDKRFPPHVEAKWKSLAYDTTDEKLKEELDNEIWSELSNEIKGDIGQNSKRVHTFQDGPWTPGSGGLHSGDREAEAYVDTTKTLWTFDVEADTFQIFAKVEFYEV